MARRLLLASMLLTACAGDDATAESGGASDAATTGSTTAATTGAATTTGAVATTTTGATTADATTTGGSTPGTDSSGAAAGPLQACLDTCAHLLECGVIDIPNCGIPCQDVDADFAGCEAEYEAQQACALALSCDAAAVWWGSMGAMRSPCRDEDTAVDACVG